MQMINSSITAILSSIWVMDHKFLNAFELTEYSKEPIAWRNVKSLNFKSLGSDPCF